MHAHTLLTNATFITMDSRLERASSLAIQNNQICCIGNEQETSSWIGPNTQVIDLQGAFVYPGFIDSHAHVFYTGHTKHHQLSLEGLQSKQAVLEKVATKVKTLSNGEWILGMGWDEHNWLDKTHPSANDLDAISPHNPVFLRRADSHAVWVNSAALSLAGINAQTPNPDGGTIYRYPNGNPTGILVDKGMKLLYPFLPTTSLEETVTIVDNVLKDCLSYGITGIHNAATYDTELEAFTILAKQNQLAIRVYAMVVLPSDLGESYLEKGTKSLGPFLEIRCLKLFMDGALGSRGAALIEPYFDNPETSGHLLWDEKTLLDKLRTAKAKGFQVAIHAIGDRATRLVLDAYEQLHVQGLGWRIEHAQIVHPTDVVRFTHNDIIASMQPLHLVADMPWIESRLGKSRAERSAFLLQSFFSSHVVVAGGSDAPIVSINPLLGMYAAITRQDLEGNPKGGWQKAQKISPQDALMMYTINAAIATKREHELGSLSVGKLADLVVLPENILTCDPEKLLTMKVLYTILNGKVAYKAT